jgi:hypothetical protein
MGISRNKNIDIIMLFVHVCIHLLRLLFVCVCWFMSCSYHYIFGQFGSYFFKVIHFYPSWVPFGKGCYQRHFAGGPWPSGRGLLRNSCDRHTVLQRGGLLPPQEWDPDDHWDSDEKQRWNKPWVNVGKPMGSSGKSSILDWWLESHP